jgi:hypothetical protein
VGQLLTGDWEIGINKEKNIGSENRDFLSIRAPLGDHGGGGGFLTGDFEIKARLGFTKSHFLWGIREMCKEGSGNGQLAALSLEVPLGTWRGAHFAGDFERQMKGSGKAASLSSYGSSGTWREATFTGDPEGYIKGWLWNSAYLSTGAPLGNMDGSSFNGDLERQ